jgi:hypothetical protein
MYGVAANPHEPRNPWSIVPHRPETRPAGAADGEGPVAGLVRSTADRLADGDAGGATRAALAEISGLAQQFLNGLRSDGATSGHFDLHLDLTQLGLRVDGRGGRSAEGHSLSIDLHVEAHRGVLETEGGAVAFEQLELSFSIEELHARVAEAAPGGEPVESQPGGRPAPGRALVDGLKELASLLDRATAGAEKRDLELDDLRDLLAEHQTELLRLLQRLGRAFEALRRRADGAEPAGTQIAACGESTEVRLEALRFVRAAPPTGTPEASSGANGAAAL